MHSEFSDLQPYRRQRPPGPLLDLSRALAWGVGLAMGVVTVLAFCAVAIFAVEEYGRQARLEYEAEQERIRTAQADERSKRDVEDIKLEKGEAEVESLKRKTDPDLFEKIRQAQDRIAAAIRKRRHAWEQEHGPLPGCPATEAPADPIQKGGK